MKIGVVSGLPRESACFDAIPRAQRNFETFAGIGPERAANGAEALIGAGARGLLSFGVAGGLAMTAPAGAVVLAEAVVDGDRRYPTDATWRDQICASISGACEVIFGTLAGTDRMISTPDGKQGLHRHSAAVACDMESHAVARVAARHGIPFVVIRAISDPHDRFVPSWVLRCLTPKGDVHMGVLLWQAARRPRSWANLAGLNRDSKSAFASLRGVALRLGPGLRF
ncbi:MAG: hypothetical protein QF510_09335 [Rhodospirillales bacterium]|nr:hypothetical protein [Rhodospirillales bacterium]